MIKKDILIFSAIIFLMGGSMRLPAQELPVFTFGSGKFINEWIVCGPFPAHGPQSLYHDYLSGAGGEENITPAEGMKISDPEVPSGMVSWKKALAGKEGMLDFRKYLQPNQNHVAYAAATIRCKKRTPAILLLGSNDMIAVWLNGKKIFVFPDPRASRPDVDKVPVVLEKGDNLLLAKVQNVGGGWWLYARFSELHQVDSQLWAATPLIAGAPIRLNNEKTGRIFSTMLINTSTTPAGPVEMISGKNKKLLAGIKTIMPGKNVWLDGIEAVNREVFNKPWETDILLKTQAGSVSFHLRTEPFPLADGTTWFVQGFHVDPVWRDSQSGYEALAFSNMSQHLRAAQGDSGFDFIASEIPYLKPYYDSHPNDRSLIRKMIRNGRIETCGSYNQPNETTIGGEAFIRNILYGRHFHENVLHDYPRVYQPWDVFGHIIQLPQILAKSEFTGTVWERSNYRSPSIRVPGIPDLYFAQSPDGTLLPTRKVSYGFPVEEGTTRDKEMETRRVLLKDMSDQKQQIPGIRYDFRLNATDEKAPTTWMIGRSYIFRNFIPQVRLDANGAKKYFKHVTEQYRTEHLDIPVVSRDVSQYNEGCELSRLDLKTGNRLGENTLIAAEKFSSFAGLLGMPWPETALDAAWRQLLFGQHHDGITGCGSDEPYLDLLIGYHKALSLADSSLTSALLFIGNNINTSYPAKGSKGSKGKTIPVTIFNSLNWQRTDVVHTTIRFDKPVRGFRVVNDRGKNIPVTTRFLEKQGRLIKSATITFVADSVPSLGYRTWWIFPDKAIPSGEHTLHNMENQIENEIFLITADKKLGGGITGIVDKRSHKEYINTKNGHPGNELILLKEGSGFEPAWRFLTTGKKYFSRDYPATVKIIRSPVYEKMVITGKMPGMQKRVQEITLYRGIDRIDFRTRLIDYKGLEGKNITENDTTPLKDQRDLYVISFPAALQGSVPVLEDRFATKVYYRSKDTLSYSSTNTYWTTHHSMNSCYQWFDNSWSVKINFGGRYSIAPGPAEIITPPDSFLRKAGYRLEAALARHGVTSTPALPDVHRSYDIQYRRFCFSAGSEGKNSYNAKLIARLPERDQQVIRQQLTQKGYAYAFVYDRKLPEAWFNYPVLMIIGKDENTTARALDNITRQLEKKRDISLPVEAYLDSTASWVGNYGLGLINHGNMAVSNEPDGSMIMTLMHTVPWQSPLLDWTHDFPERKTHVFDYALKPHKGNWQDAGMVHAGYEFNNPLIACQLTSHVGELPAEYSFVNTGNSHCVISAIKPVSSGIETFSRKKPDIRKGMIIRLYDPRGEDTKVHLATSFSIGSVQKTNLMERKEKPVPFEAGGFSFHLTPYSIETFRLQPKNIPAEQTEESVTRPCYPVYCRYWQHNEGAAPAGYNPVNVVIIAPGDYDAEKFHDNIRQIRVFVTNDYTDRDVKGKVTVETPPGVRAVPAEFPYHVAANSEQGYPVTLILKGSVTPGFIRATIVQDSVTLFDVAEFRLPRKQFGHADHPGPDNTRIRWSVTSDSTRVTVTLSNPFAQKIDGEVALAGPVETWGDCPGNPAGLLQVSPWKQAFNLPPGGSRTLNFNISHKRGKKDNAYWLAARLSYYGYLAYKPAVGNLKIMDQNKPTMMISMHEKQLTFTPKTHALDNNDNFSSDDRFLCYDTRGTVFNEDIGNSKTIEKVETATGQETVLWNPPSITGKKAAPGVGAASFHPFKNKVIFINGPFIDEVKARGYYSKTNRTAIEVVADGSQKFNRVDMRDVTNDPTTPGAHRGGTHRHEYCRNGNRIGFTYDDYLIRNIDRTIGFMQPDPKVPKGYTHYFAVILKPAEKGKARPGEIEKAYGDSWVDSAGTMRAFIGKVRQDNGKDYDYDLFVADIPEDIDITTAFSGTHDRYPEPPTGITIRRLTKGMWVNGIVRGSYDGSRIAFAAKDNAGTDQLFIIRADGTDKKPVQVTHLKNSVTAIRWHVSDKWIFFISAGNIMASYVGTVYPFGTTIQLTHDKKPRDQLVLSHDGNMAAYIIPTITKDTNGKIVKDASGHNFRQIWVMKIDWNRVNKAIKR